MMLWCNYTHSIVTTKRSNKIHSGVVHMLDATPCVPQPILSILEAHAVNEAFIPLVAIILLLLAESSQACIAVLPLCHRKTRARLSREHGGSRFANGTEVTTRRVNLFATEALLPLSSR